MIPLFLSLAMLNADVQAESVALVEAGLKRGDYPGASFVAREGDEEIAFVARGWADLAEQRPILRSTVYQAMSMTKPIVVAAAMRLVERRLLDLDAPVSRYLPSFATMRVQDGDARRTSRPPTVRELMTHTSGIHPDNPAGLSDEQKRAMTLADYTELIAREPLTSEPGTRVRYSGTGTTVLGRVVEVLCGKELERALFDEVFLPLGMDDTSFFFRPEWRGRLAQVVFREEGKWMPLDENPERPGARLANPAGGLYSTADDMADFVEAFACSGTFRGLRWLKPETVAEILRIQVKPEVAGQDGTTRWGLGFNLHVAPSPIAGVVGHEGAFGTSFWFHPPTGRSGVVMTQHMGRPATIRNELAQLLARMAASPVSRPAANRESY